MRNMGGIAGARRGMRGGAGPATGFTLIELMVVVAIVAILSAIAVPAYQNAVRKGKRGQAKADIVEIGQLAERFRTINNTYTGFALTGTQDRSPRQGTERAYNVAINVASGTAFTVTATPVNAQLKDTRCGTLTLNQAGQKTASGVGGVTECW